MVINENTVVVTYSNVQLDNRPTQEALELRMLEGRGDAVAEREALKPNNCLIVWQRHRQYGCT